MKYDDLFDLYYPQALNAFYEIDKDILKLPRTNHPLKQSFEVKSKEIIIETEYNTKDTQINNLPLDQFKLDIQ